MAGFSDQAIGLYLDLDDRMTKQFPGIEKKYASFTGNMVKLTDRVSKIATTGVKSYGDLIERLEELPTATAAAWKKSESGLRKQIKALTVPVKLEFTTTSMNRLKKGIGGAIADILSKTSIRMSATAPLKKSAIFDASVGLRAVYKDMVQPPDMKGFYQGLPKFAEGGIVPNAPGANPNMDSILAMLTPGEMVLPKEVVKGLRDTGTGQFAGTGPEFKEAYADYLNLSKAVEKLSQELAASGGVVASTEKFENALNALAIQEVKVLDMSKQFAHTTLDGMMSPALKMTGDRARALEDALADVTVEMKDTEKAVKKAEAELEDLSDTVGGPRNRNGATMRFLGMAAAVTLVRQGFNQLTSGATQAFQTMDGQQIDGFTDAINTANLSLGMGRVELRQYKRELGGLASSVVGFNDIGAAVNALTNAGATDPEFIRGAAESLALFSVATGAAADGAAHLVYKLVDMNGWSQENAASLLANVTAMKQTVGSAMNVDETIGMLSQSFQNASFQLYFNNQSLETQQQLLTGLTALTAATAENFSGLGDVITRGLGGDTDAIKNLVSLGVGYETLQEAGRTGDFSEVIARIGGSLQDLSPMALQALQDNFGLTAEDAANFAANQEGIIDVFNRSTIVAGQTTDGLTELRAASENQVTGFKRMQNAATAWIGNMEMGAAVQNGMTAAMSGLTAATEATGLPLDRYNERIMAAASNYDLFNITGVDVIDFMKEFNPMALIGVGHLAMMGVNAGIATVKLAGMAAGSILSGIGKLLGLLRSTAVASAALATPVAGGGGAAGGGFLRGLAGGIASFANPATIAGLAVIVGAISVLMLVAGASIWVAGDALQHVANAIGMVAESVAQMVSRGIDTVFGFLGKMTDMEPRRMMMTGLGFAAIGVGIAAFAGSIGLAGALMMPGLPAFLIFASVLGVMNATGLLDKIVEKVSEIAETFAGVDRRNLIQGALGVMAVGLFMLGFGVAMAVAGIGSALAVVGTATIAFSQGLSDMLELPSDDSLVSHFNNLGATYANIDGPLLLKGAKGLLYMALFAVAYGLGVAAAGLGAALGTIGKGAMMMSEMVAVAWELPSDASIVSHFNNLGTTYSKLDRPVLMEGARGLVALALFGVALTAGMTAAALGTVMETVAKVTLAVSSVISSVGELDTPTQMVSHFNELARSYSGLDADTLQQGGRGLNALAVFGLAMTAGMAGAALGDVAQLAAGMVGAVSSVLTSMFSLDTPAERVAKVNETAKAYANLDEASMSSATSKFGTMIRFMLAMTGKGAVEAGTTLADLGTALVAGVAGWGRSITDFVNLTDGPVETAQKIQELAKNIDSALGTQQLNKTLGEIEIAADFMLELSSTFNSLNGLQFTTMSSRDLHAAMAQSQVMGSQVMVLTAAGLESYSVADENALAGMEWAGRIVTAYAAYVNAVGSIDYTAVSRAALNSASLANAIGGMGDVVDAIMGNGDANNNIAQAASLIADYDNMIGAIGNLENDARIGIDGRAQGFAQAVRATAQVVTAMESQVEQRVNAVAEVTQTQTTTIAGRVESSDERTHQLLTTLIRAVQGGVSNTTPPRPSNRPNPNTTMLAGG